MKTLFYYVQRPDGEILEYTRREKAERVARLYNTAILERPTEKQRLDAVPMYFN